MSLLTEAQREAIAEPVYDAYRLGKFGEQEYLPMWHELETKPLGVPEVAKALVAVERLVIDARIQAMRDARDEISEMLDGFPQAGRHTRARWAVEWLSIMIERAVLPTRPVCDCAPDCAERIACTEIGTLGHMGCGWCEVHDQARHICLCQVTDLGTGTGGAS